MLEKVCRCQHVRSQTSRHGAELGLLSCVARRKKVLPATDEGAKRDVLDRARVEILQVTSPNGRPIEMQIFTIGSTRQE